MNWKTLTNKQFEEAPAEVQNVYIHALCKIPIGTSNFNEAVEKYPEYFPEETELRRKWAAVPQEIQDTYWEEYKKLDKEIYKDVPHKGKGLLFFANNPKEDKEHSIAWNKANEKSKPLKRALHNKYFSKYGIKWNGV